MVGDLADLVHPFQLAGLGLVAEVVPRFDARQKGLEAVALEPLQVRLREQGQAAFRDEVDAVGRHRLLDRVEVVVETDPEVRIVPGDARPWHRPDQEPQVVFQHPEIERLIRHDRVDAEAARVGTPETAEHRHDLDERRFSKRGLDELPALANAGEVGGLARCREVQADRPVGRAVAQHLADHDLVGEAHDVVEVLPSVLRVAARMGPPKRRYRLPRAKQVADRIPQERGFGERADEDQVDRVRQFRDEIFESGIAD